MNNNYKVYKLKNGVTLYLYPNKKLKRFFVEYVIGYGSNGKWFRFAYDEKKYEVVPGVAHFLEHLLGEHSINGNIYTNFSKRNYGRNGVTTLNKTYYFFSGIRDIKKSIKELIQAIDMPVFTEEDVEETRKSILSECKIDKNDYQNTMFSLLNRNAYNSYDKIDESLCVIGTEETTKKIDYDMLKLCYDAYYYHKNKQLLIAGNFDEKSMLKYVERIYETIPEHEKNVRVLRRDPTPVRKRKDIVHMDVVNPYIGITFKENLPIQYNQYLIDTYADLLIYSKFSYSNKFINKLLDKKIIENRIISSTTREDGKLLFTFKVYTKKYKKYKRKLIKELKNRRLSKKKFELFKKAIMSDIAFTKDNLYIDFYNFYNIVDYPYRYDPLEFIKNLDYKDFKYFMKMLKFDDYIEVIIEPENKDKK